MKKNNIATLLLSGLLVLGACAPAVSNTSTSDNSNTSSATSSETVNSSSSTSTAKPDAGASSSSSTTVVKPERDYTYVGVTNKDSISSVDSHKKQFLNKNIVYRIGDDNGFDFRPIVFTKKGTEAAQARNDIDMDVTVFVKGEDGNFTKLSTTDYAKYVSSLNSKTCVIDFTQEAVGKTFKLSYTPKDLKASEKEDDTLVAECTFLVEDGYNVYKADELAYFYNEELAPEDKEHGKEAEEPATIPQPGSSAATPVTYQAAWDAFKTSKNLELNYAPKGLFLQNDLKVTKDNLPKEYFYSENDLTTKVGIGSMKDRLRVYQHDLKQDETFKFFGNAFTMDFKEVKQIYYFENDLEDVTSNILKVSHNDLFYVHEGVGQAIFSDFNLIGNGPLEEQDKFAGALMGIKNAGPDLTCSNLILSQFFIMFEPDAAGGNGKLIIDQTKCENAYSNFVYNYGTDQLVVKNSEFKGSGGPAVLSVAAKEDGVLRTPKSTIINTSISSEVVGTEPWFVNMGNMVSMEVVEKIAALRQLDLLFNAYLHKTILTPIVDGGDATTLNMKALNMLDPKLLEENPLAFGKFLFTEKINDADVTASYDYELRDDVALNQNALAQYYLGNFQAAPETFFYLQGANGAKAAIKLNTQNLMATEFLSISIGENGGPKESQINPADFAKGDTIAVYAFGFCIVLGIHDIAA